MSEPLVDLPLLRGDLERVEVALREAVLGNDPFLTEVAAHLLTAGGKRLRPMLALAASYVADANRPSPHEVVLGAVAVELVHVGSLYHDDVMDEAATRRGVETANARWGNMVAILSGDYCLARAAEIAARLGSEVAGLIGHTIGRLVEGQVGELKTLFDVSRSEAAHLSSIDGKTASLMSTACRVGALMSGLDESGTEALTDYGQKIGMVFQIADDILDLVATEAQLGKPSGNDVIEGVYTLPVIRALRDPAVGDELNALLIAGVDRTSVERVRKLVRSSGAIESAVITGRTYADQAADATRSLGASGPIDELARLGHVLLDRLPS